MNIPFCLFCPELERDGCGGSKAAMLAVHILLLDKQVLLDVMRKTKYNSENNTLKENNITKTYKQMKNK